MKTIRFNLIMMLGALIFSACSNESINDNLANEEVVPRYLNSNIMKFVETVRKSNNSNTASSRMASTSMSYVFEGDFMINMVDDAKSVLHRNSNSVTVNLTANNLDHYDPSGKALTLWVAFLEPDFSGVAAMYRAGGKIIGSNGDIRLNGSVIEGQTKDRFVFVNAETERPIEDVSYPIVVVVKSHGDADPNMIVDQISTLEGGCEGDPDGNGPLGDCYEFLFAYHF